MNREDIEKLLNMEDPKTKANYSRWDKGDCGKVGLVEILLDQTIREHMEDNGIYYDKDYDRIKTRYDSQARYPTHVRLTKLARPHQDHWVRHRGFKLGTIFEVENTCNTYRNYNVKIEPNSHGSISWDMVEPVTNSEDEASSSSTE